MEVIELMGAMSLVWFGLGSGSRQRLIDLGLYIYIYIYELSSSYI